MKRENINRVPRDKWWVLDPNWLGSELINKLSIKPVTCSQLYQFTSQPNASIKYVNKAINSKEHTHLVYDE